MLSPHNLARFVQSGYRMARTHGALLADHATVDHDRAVTVVRAEFAVNHVRRERAMRTAQACFLDERDVERSLSASRLGYEAMIAIGTMAFGEHVLAVERGEQMLGQIRIPGRSLMNGDSICHGTPPQEMMGWWAAISQHCRPRRGQLQDVRGQFDLASFHVSGGEC